MKVVLKLKGKPLRKTVTEGKTVKGIYPGYISELSSGLLIPHYFIHCAAYYIHDDSLIADHEFHELCRRIVDEWNMLEHMHKSLIDINQLKIKSGKAYDKIPTIAKETAMMLLQSCYQSRYHPEFKK